MFYLLADQEETLLIDSEYNIMKNLSKEYFLNPISLLKNENFDIIILI